MTFVLDGSVTLSWVFPTKHPKQPTGCASR